MVVDTEALGRPASFNGTMPRRDWSVVFRSCAGLFMFNTPLTTRLPHDRVALVNSLQVDETVLKASLDLYDLLLHLTKGPALDKEVTSGDGEGQSVALGGGEIGSEAVKQINGNLARSDDVRLRR